MIDRGMRLWHKDPALNIEELFYVEIGETPHHYLALIYKTKDGENQVSSVVHAVWKADYQFEVPQESVPGVVNDASDLI